MDTIERAGNMAGISLNDIHRELLSYRSDLQKNTEQIIRVETKVDGVNTWLEKLNNRVAKGEEKISILETSNALAKEQLSGLFKEKSLRDTHFFTWKFWAVTGGLMVVFTFIGNIIAEVLQRVGIFL